MLLALSIACCCSAALPAALTLVNLRAYQAPPCDAGDPLPAIEVCIPARNEEAGIARCLQAILDSAGANLTVLVVDDHSTDATANAVGEIARHDGRVRLLEAPPLPRGWNGKQHACWYAAKQSSAPILCFLDADVRLEPEALARMAGFLVQSKAALVSGFPREETGTPLEWLLLPLIHFVLLGYLPLSLSQRSRAPGLAAGCGQFLMSSNCNRVDIITLIVKGQISRPKLTV